MAFDFAIFGSSPLAVLLGGLLATMHGKQVCLIGEPWSPWSLPRRTDIAALVATRPDTWAMLKAGSAETTKLINVIGKGLVDHVDPLLIAEGPQSLEAIAHMRAVAVGYGYAMERVADRSLAESGAAWRLRRNCAYSVLWHSAQLAAVRCFAITNPRWSSVGWPCTALWQSRHVTPFCACWLISN